MVWASKDDRKNVRVVLDLNGMGCEDRDRDGMDYIDQYCGLKSMSWRGLPPLRIRGYQVPFSVQDKPATIAIYHSLLFGIMPF